MIRSKCGEAVPCVNFEPRELEVDRTQICYRVRTVVILSIAGSMLVGLTSNIIATRPGMWDAYSYIFVAYTHACYVALI